MKTRLFLMISLFMLIGWSGCKKDDNNSVNTGTPFVEKVKTSISGRVFDEQGNPVNGATVTAGDKSSVTNQWGIYLIENIDLSKNRAIVTVSKSGFWNQTGACHPSKNSITYLNLTLFDASSTQILQAASGGTVTLSSGANVTFPVNAFATANGSLYSGSVNVCMHELASDDAKLGVKLPGSDLIAINNSGKDGILQTFGMIGVKLTDQSGNALQIIAGKKANLTFPIAANQIANAPATIALWYFDETLGKWKEDGIALKTGNNYKADVAHFTWWNCDVWVPYAYISGYVKDCLGNPIAGCDVETYGQMGGGDGHGITDANGYYAGAIASGENVDITAIDYYNTGFSSQTVTVNLNVGVSAVIPDLIINNGAGCNSTITGTIVNCNWMPISATVLCFDNSNALINYQVTANGSFYFSVPVGTFNILAYKSVTNGNASFNVNSLGLQYNIGSISLCDTLSNNNNLQLSFVSPLVGAIASSFQVSGCSVIGTSPNQTIEFANTDTITGATTTIDLKIPSYSNGTYAWNSTNSNIIGSMSSNGQNYTISKDPNGTGSTTISNAAAIGGVISGSFSGAVILTTNGGIPITGTLSSNFNITRDH